MMPFSSCVLSRNDKAANNIIGGEREGGGEDILPVGLIKRRPIMSLTNHRVVA